MTPPPTPTVHTPSEIAELKERYVEEYKDCFNPSEAAQRIGVPYKFITKWRRVDPDFKEAIQLAHEHCLDALEESAYRRALQGDNQMTTLLLKGRRSNVFAEKQKLDIKVAAVDVSQLSDAQLEAVANGADPRVVVATGGLPGLPENKSESRDGEEAEGEGSEPESI